MKLQALLTTLYYLLFSSSAKQINETIKGARDARAPKSTTIYHNGHPVEVHNIPQYSQHFQGFQALPSNVAPNKAELGPKIALQRDKVVIQNENSYLQDSYGNRYYNPPQQLAYKTIFPQQFVSLQQLPMHFSQPLLGPAHNKQAYSLPQFSFAEPFNRPAIHQPLSESVVYDFPKTRQSFPLVLPPQHLNVPIQSHYKIAEAAPFISGNHQLPVTYSFHPSPAQRFFNFAPEMHNHHNSATNLHTNAQPSSSVISQNIQEHQKQHPSAPVEGATKPKKKLLKKDEGKPIRASQELKSIEPKYLKPRKYSNSIVPPVQQFLPEIQNVLKYSIIPRQHFPLTAEPEKRAQQQEGPFENRIKQIVTRPEKNHNVVINEYTPPEKHELKEEVKAEVIDEEENEEKTFNEGYQEAAKGFPAYSSYNDDYEKKIYDEASYGEPHYHDSLSFGPPSDEPYSSDPEELSSKYINRESLQHNAHDDDDSKEFRPIPYFSDNKKHSLPKGKKPSGKWSKQSEHPKTSSKSERDEQEIPYHYTTHQHSETERHKSPSKSARYEIDYSNGFSPPHSDGHRQAHHTHRPEYHTHRSHVDPPASRFVEPQYQYGFEPIEARADSEELASSASASAAAVATGELHGRRPSTNKKVYKENWFISKTSSTEAGADS